jgi:hypothetical protein
MNLNFEPLYQLKPQKKPLVSIKDPSIHSKTAGSDLVLYYLYNDYYENDALHPKIFIF